MTAALALTSSALTEGGAIPKRYTCEGQDAAPPLAWAGRHRYFHKLYALDTLLGDLGEPRKDALEKAMSGHVLAESRIVGTYEKEHA